jgi:hypothetical protein
MKQEVFRDDGYQTRNDCVDIGAAGRGFICFTGSQRHLFSAKQIERSTGRFCCTIDLRISSLEKDIGWMNGV